MHQHFIGNADVCSCIVNIEGQRQLHDKRISKVGDIKTEPMVL